MTPKYSKLPFEELFYKDVAEKMILLVIPSVNIFEVPMKIHNEIIPKQNESCDELRY